MTEEHSIVEELQAIELENPGLFMAFETEDKSWIRRPEEARRIILERRAKRKCLK
jgi:hypothetical protein